MEGAKKADTKIERLERDLKGVFETATKIYRLMLPREVVLEVDGSKETRQLMLLTDQRRPLYQGFQWQDAEEDAEDSPESTRTQSRWIATFKGDTFQLVSCALPWDDGTWQDSTGEARPDVSCTLVGEPLLSQGDLEAFRSCFALGGCYGSVTFATRKVLEQSGIGERCLEGGETLLVALKRLLTHMCGIVRELLSPAEVRAQGLELPNPPEEATWPVVFASLRSLATFAELPVEAELKKQLGMNVKNPLSAVRCMIYNCRLLDLCDIRSKAQPGILRLFHHVFLRRWQALHGGKVRYVDLATRQCSVQQQPPPKAAGHVRFVVVSDTHGWDPEIMLPDGDVLLHCGDLLFEGAGCRPGTAGTAGAAGANVPTDLAEALQHFGSPVYQRYRWVFVTGGNHDRSLHEFWQKNFEWFCEQLPPNVVFLEAAAPLLSPALQETCAAKARHLLNVVDRGAVKLRPNMELCSPCSERPGWTIAGTGLSLAHNAWSPNRAFQLPEKEEAPRREAVDRLLTYSPDVVMTHGPPRGHGDGTHGGKAGKGDEILREGLDRNPSVRVHVFGHVHEESEPRFGMGASGRCSINAAMSTELYSAARPPLVFDLGLAGNDGGNLVEAMPQTPPTSVAQFSEMEAVFFDCLEPTDVAVAANREEDMARALHALDQHQVPFRSFGVESVDLDGDALDGDADGSPRSADGGPRSADGSPRSAKGDGHGHASDSLRRPLLQGQMDGVACARDGVAGAGAAAADGVAPPQMEWLVPATPPGCQDWLPEWAVADLVKEMLTEVREVTDESRKLTMFDVAGPATKLALLSVVNWVFAISFPWFAAYESEVHEGALFARYPWWLWLVVVPFLIFALVVEWWCLSLIVAVQVQWVGKFSFLGLFECKSYETWLVVQGLISVFGRMDIAASSLFMAQVLKSSPSLRGDLSRLWARHFWLPIRIDIAFKMWYTLRLFQLLYTLVMVVPVQRRVRYGFRSMHKGYRVLMTYLSVPQFYVEGTISGKTMRRYKVWHSDALETLALFGGLIAITNQGLPMTIRRALYELNRDTCRCLHIIYMKLRHLFWSFFFLKILDNLVKLGLQVTVMKVTASYFTERGGQNMGSLRFLVADWQMVLTVTISICTAFGAVLQEGLKVSSLSAAIEKASTNDGNSQSGKVVKNLESIRYWMSGYKALVFIMSVCLCMLAVQLVGASLNLVNGISHLSKEAKSPTLV